MSEELQDQMARCISQRRNLETIFNSLTDGLVAVDRSLRVMNLNSALLDITGFSRPQALGATCGELFRPPEGERRCVLAGAIERGRMVQDLAMDIRRPDGEIRHIELTTHALQDDSGEPQGVVAIVKDRTEVQKLQSALRGPNRYECLVGKNHRMRELYELVDDIAESDATVLITGESGTGKEMVAQAVHNRSHRRSGPFIKVNCSALSEGLLESELFGHVKGAFTGAIRDKKGRFEMADGGSLFLDEIGDIAPSVQIKLLRVLQEREFERVGGTETVKVDVRVIAATNRDLEQRRREGRFREDLYYRLYVVPIELPPLRDRKEDVPLLVEHFVKRFRERTGKAIREVSPEAFGLLMDYDWPGNVRELENAIEHAFVKCHGDSIQESDLPRLMVRSVRGDVSSSGRPVSEKDRLMSVLEQTGWNRSRTARILGMHRTTVWRKMKEFGIREPALE